MSKMFPASVGVKQTNSITTQHAAGAVEEVRCGITSFRLVVLHEHVAGVTMSKRPQRCCLPSLLLLRILVAHALRNTTAIPPER